MDYNGMLQDPRIKADILKRGFRAAGTTGSRIVTKLIQFKKDVTSVKELELFLGIHASQITKATRLLEEDGVIGSREDMRKSGAGRPPKLFFINPELKNAYLPKVLPDEVQKVEEVKVKPIVYCNWNEVVAAVEEFAQAEMKEHRKNGSHLPLSTDHLKAYLQILYETKNVASVSLREFFKYRYPSLKHPQKAASNCSYSMKKICLIDQVVPGVYKPSSLLQSFFDSYQPISTEKLGTVVKEDEPVKEVLGTPAATIRVEKPALPIPETMRVNIEALLDSATNNYRRCLQVKIEEHISANWPKFVEDMMLQVITTI